MIQQFINLFVTSYINCYNKPMFQPSKIRVAVLRGGRSPGYDVSLRSGAHVLKHLPEKYHGLDILIDKNGLWHMHGLPRSPDKILKQIDVVFNVLKEGNIEDRNIQILQSHGVPFTGSLFLPSSISTNKVLSKEIFLKNGLKTPHYTIVKSKDDLYEKSVNIFKTFIMPVVIKPATSGFSLGVSVVNTVSELNKAIEEALKWSHTALVEEYIRGKEITCGVIENFRGDKLHALIPVEICLKGSAFFDHNSKNTNIGFEKICPANLSKDEKEIIEEYARCAHQILGLRHYSGSDFIIASRRGVYILETDSWPGLTERSSLPMSLAAGGTPISHFLDHVLQLALN